MTALHHTATVAAILFVSLLAAVTIEQIRWERYHREHRCVVAETERREHLPDRVTYRCAGGAEVVR